MNTPQAQPALESSPGLACPCCLQIHGHETLCRCWICDCYVHPHFLHLWFVEGHRVAICPACAHDPEELSKHKVRAMVLEAALREITRTAYDEANRIANHCSDGAARWAMRNLYDAANKAKAVLSANAPASPTPTPPLVGASGSAICWEPHPTDLGRLRGFLPAIPSVTLFLIDVCDDKPHRGTMRGAFIPDDEDGTDLNERALMVTLKHRAEAYLRDWDEARAKQSPNASPSATEAGQ